VLRTFLSSVFGDTAPLETPKGDAEASKLQWMPDYNFQAFIRRDVSTFGWKRTLLSLVKRESFSTYQIAG